MNSFDSSLPNISMTYFAALFYKVIFRNVSPDPAQLKFSSYSRTDFSDPSSFYKCADAYSHTSIAYWSNAPIVDVSLKAGRRDLSFKVAIAR